MFEELPLRHFSTHLDSNEYQTLGFFMFPQLEHVWFIGCVFHTPNPTCAFLMPCSCIAHMHLLHTSRHPYHAIFYFMLLHHFDLLASLACHVFFILCSILFLRCFLFCLSFIFHSPCLSYASLSFFLSSFLSHIFLGPFIYLWQKRRRVSLFLFDSYAHSQGEKFYLVHIRRERNSIWEMHIPRGRRHLFMRKPCFVLFYIMFVFFFSSSSSSFFLSFFLFFFFFFLMVLWVTFSFYALLLS